MPLWPIEMNTFKIAHSLVFQFPNFDDKKFLFQSKFQGVRLSKLRWCIFCHEFLVEIICVQDKGGKG